MDIIRVCLTGGSTGGHIFPLLLVARKIKEKSMNTGTECEIIFVGPKPIQGLENVFEKEKIRTYYLPEIKIRRYFSLQNFIDFLKSPFVFLKVFLILFSKMPNVTFSKGGGLTSFFVVFLSWFFRIPSIIHESDSVPGLANRLSGKFATRIAISFAESVNYFSKNKTALTGHPVDTESFIQPIFDKDYERFKLDPDEPIILVIGGSQGSHFLNELIFRVSPELLKFAQVVHQTGEKDYDEFSLAIKGYLSQTIPQRLSKYHAFSLIPQSDLALLMKMSNIIISRAGAGTIFEIAMAGKPSILIPLPNNVAASDHQRRNAYIFSKSGACIVLEQNNASPEILLATIRKILSNPNVAETMMKAAKNFAKPNALDKIVQELWLLARI